MLSLFSPWRNSHGLAHAGQVIYQLSYTVTSIFQMLEGTRLTLDKGLKSSVPSNVEDSKTGNAGILFRDYSFLYKPVIHHDPPGFHVTVVQETCALDFVSRVP